VRTYVDATGLAAIVASSGYIEIALPGASAAAELGIALGDQVVLRPGG
jgi:S-adenosylmethionine hydrolase